jgi:7-cyano-7-deazaguanine synthase in queuosine biosynthesis
LSKKKKLKIVKMAAIVKVVLFVSVSSEKPREGHTCGDCSSDYVVQRTSSPAAA